ncbi:MAG: IS4 family transposase [Lentisphaeria bacterium]|nr:IS4 family transposase [Lentisphaeria bacterium]
MSKKNTKKKINPKTVESFVHSIFEGDMHAKRVMSLANAVTGVIAAGALGIHGIGRGLASAKGLVERHAVKQVDRLVGNRKVVLDELFSLWVPYVLANRQKIMVNLDWTEFDDDDQSMLVASIQTKHGRSTALIWKTVIKSKLKNRRNAHEDELMVRLRELVPPTVKVTIVADRGFGDQKLYDFLKELGFEYIIRFKGNIQVTNDKGEARMAREWMGKNGRMRVLRDAFVTADRYPISTVICVHDKGMKDPWCIVSSDPSLKGSEAKKVYGKRFTCEETFRDVKDIHFGMGMSWQPIGRTDRRDRMMMMAVLAMALLTMLGEAGEQAGLDRLLKTSTRKRRQLSLFRQGLRWYSLMPTLREDRLQLLMEHFVAVMAEHEVCRELYGAI